MEVTEELRNIFKTNFTEFLSKFEKVWCWSDTHFSHANIIKYSDRPFADIDEMNIALELAWQETVGPDDLIIHCGDFAFKDTESANEIVARCPGVKLLIVGNHDYKNQNKIRELNFDFMSLKEEFKYNEFNFVLCHVPLPVAALSSRFCIHGHLHTKIYKNADDSPSKYHRCISVEQTNYKPILLSEVCEQLIQKGKIE